MIISTNDGLSLQLSDNGSLDSVSIDGNIIPQLPIPGGMYFYEFGTQNPSIVPNSSFETGTTIPDSWYLYTRPGNLNTPIWDNTVYHTGAKSIKVSISGTTDQKSGYPESYRIQVKPNTYYKLSAWLKGESLGGTNGPAVRIREFNVNNQYLLQTNLVFDKGTYEWTKKYITFQTTANTIKGNIYANIWDGYGTFWLDDIELYEEGSDINLVLNNGFEDVTYNIPELNGIAFDSISIYAWGQLENYRREQWEYADMPLIISSDGTPILLNLFSIYGCVRDLSNEAHSKNQLTFANMFVGAYNPFIQFIDVTGSELEVVEESDFNSLYRRCLSYKKTISNILDTVGPELTYLDIEKYIKNSLFYGIFPGISVIGRGEHFIGESTYWDRPDLYERDRPLFKKYIPIIKEISKAGWEVVPYAISDNLNIILERYGSNNVIYYTIKNIDKNNEQSSIITVDLKHLGYSTSRDITVTDMLSSASYTISSINNKLDIPINIFSNDVTVMKIDIPVIDITKIILIAGLFYGLYVISKNKD